MTSDRNRASGDDALLDAARDCVLAVGLRRTTLTDVARRAGVSRMTMYRRWPDMATLMADLMTREWSALAVAAEDEAVGLTTRDRIVDGLVRGARALRRHAMFRRVIELDPEVLLPYLVDRRGSVQDAILAHLIVSIGEGRDDGSLRRQDPVLLARAAVLATHGFVISASTMTGPAGTGREITEDALDDELRLLLDRFLRP
ncbi:TetR family transcriptional regulator [Actinoplanes sp. NBRC 14428]|uniref:TetR family transcriptional regulator n=1 Tax=Pseudosporangium ferrugineum TaxID=439699 RepID=A0A2T0RNP0_9ACTN|nr:TetR/AcrR family transcriptional regulator [Pseudosporangium ferrugineum]PRY22809.1 TetR family transcriptional regulator [Pseudosporangium ferrugineum]BCJ55186.1 TetR family transcriptional regulator [Actinoplanes sp. NBRC 14428]